jgi:acyl-CoA thioester hydrolase|tara:strand:+ start:1412 stop:1807 length:396 start_codon:yes stop_codon:yes gene_type:complete
LTLKAEISYEIPFYDTDGLNIIWYGNYFKYFELARNLLFKKNKIDIPVWSKYKFLLLIVDTKCKYYKPLRYNDKIKIIASIKEKTYRLKICYQIFNLNTKKLLADGYTVQVAVNKNNFQMYSKLPSQLIKK